jgi:hypothetical protein
MRGNAVLVETTVLVDYLRGSDAAAEYWTSVARAETLEAFREAFATLG